MTRPARPREPLYDLEYHPHYLARHSVPDPNSDCVLWTGALHRQGYGWIGAWRQDGTKIMTTTHRIVARIKYGRALSPQEMVLHTCGCARCVNPDHLVLGTGQDRERFKRQRRK